MIFLSRRIVLFFIALLSGFSFQAQVFNSQMICNKTAHINLLLEDKPMKGAHVRLDKKIAQTDRDGNVVIKNLCARKYTIEISQGDGLYVHKTMDLSRAEHFSFVLGLSDFETILQTIVYPLDKRRKDWKNTTDKAIISQKDLEKNTGNTLAQTLEQTPGVSSLSLGVGISKPVIRGLSGNRVAVLYDGIKQEDQQWGHDHGLNIANSSVYKAEIIKGPAALRFGSDALGGVIKLYSNRSIGAGRVENMFSSFYKSNNRNVGFAFSRREGFNKGWYYGVDASYQNYSDYRVPADYFVYNTFILPIYNHRIENTGGREHHGQIIVGQRKTHNDWSFEATYIKQKLGVFKGATGIPRLFNLRPNSDPRKITLPYQEVSHLRLNFHHKWEKQDDVFSQRIGYQFNDRQERSVPEAHGRGPGFGNLAVDLKLHTIYYEANYRRTLGHFAQEFGLNAQYQTNKIDGFSYAIPNYKALQSGLYGIFEYQIAQRLFADAGLRLNFAHRQSKAYYEAFRYGQNNDLIERIVPSYEKNYWNWVGAAGISYKHGPALVKAHVGKSFRIPNAYELSANGVHHGNHRHEKGDVNLTSEKGWQFDVSLQYNKERLRLGVSPFFNYYSNYIFLYPTDYGSFYNSEGRLVSFPDAGRIYEYRQTKAWFSGFESNLFLNLYKHLSLQGYTQWVYSKNISESEGFPFMPPFLADASLDYQVNPSKGFIKEWALSFGYQYSAAQNRVLINEKPTKAYSLARIKWMSTFKIIKNQYIDLHFFIDNLFNKIYKKHLSQYRIIDLPEPGRNFNIKLKYYF